MRASERWRLSFGLQVSQSEEKLGARLQVKNDCCAPTVKPYLPCGRHPPKKTKSGFKTPPQLLHSATVNLSYNFSGKSMSPSGRTIVCGEGGVAGLAVGTGAAFQRVLVQM
jgi:hypothetical protein